MCALDTPSQVQRDDRDAGSPDSEDDRGVLLYYKYVTLHATRGEDRRPEVARFFRELCSSQRQVGRVRVARDGINVTVGGRMEGLHKHIEAVVAHPLLAGRDIDYKLAPSTGALNEQARRESGFDQLCVSICKEVVSLGLERNGEDAPLEETAEHLSPREFHSRLQQAAARIAAAEAAEDGGGAARQHGFSGARDEASGSRGVVLLDARNVYETRIGGFRAPGVEFIDPQLRCFADLKGWMDANEARLRDRRVMMYCTGGVRCERASAYLRRKGRGFQDVVQLAGGIQRYLEEYSGGGFFVGKNFVFDERVAVGSGSPSVLGRCLACGSECDDYTPRARCSSCRMLVLLCPRCVSPAADGAAIGPAPAPLCELCSARQRSRRSPGGAGTPTGGGKLRVLCLHGFRQTGRQFRGRTAALRKKLRNVADFEFADGPHRLPRFVKPRPGLDELTEADRRSRPEAGAGQQDATEAAGSEAAGGKRAWLVSEEMQTFDRSAALAAGGAARAVPAPAFVQDRQLERQTLGWPEAVEQLREVLDQAADSFDGVMGFSQGAAVAAALCAMQQQGWMLRCSCCGRLRRPPLPQPQASCRWCACADAHAEPAPAAASGRLRFAWLCCGYPPPLPPQLQHSRLLEVPSLHVGCGPLDRQLAAQDSDTLLALFAPHTAVAVHNSRGHFIPATAACIAQYHSFLARFLPPQSEDSPCPQPPSHLEGPQKG